MIAFPLTSQLGSLQQLENTKLQLTGLQGKQGIKGDLKRIQILIGQAGNQIHMHDSTACLQSLNDLYETFVILGASNRVQRPGVKGLHADFKAEAAGNSLLTEKLQQLLTQCFRNDFKLENLMSAVLIHIACNLQSALGICIEGAIQQLHLRYPAVLQLVQYPHDILHGKHADSSIGGGQAVGAAVWTASACLQIKILPVHPRLIHFHEIRCFKALQPCKVSFAIFRIGILLCVNA